MVSAISTGTVRQPLVRVRGPAMLPLVVALTCAVTVLLGLHLALALAGFPINVVAASLVTSVLCTALLLTRRSRTTTTLPKATPWESFL